MNSSQYIVAIPLIALAIIGYVAIVPALKRVWNKNIFDTKEVDPTDVLLLIYGIPCCIVIPGVVFIAVLINFLF